MIIDLEKFILNERSYWEELLSVLDNMESKSNVRMDMENLRRFHYLYERTSSDLAKLTTFASEPETRRYLESLVARAYGHIHETRKKPHRIHPLSWFFKTFPQTFRHHIKAFYLATAIMIGGCLFAGIIMTFDASSKEMFLPYQHAIRTPSERVADEESINYNHLKGVKMQGAAFYMTHNTGVAIKTMAAGITWGIGTIILLFQTGMMLGAISIDFIAANETKFLIGWLLPHGSVEIPAILLAGQAGFMLASALIGRGTRTALKQRMREISQDLVTMILGVAILLVWAGIIEAFLSQYHEPTIPYSLKIGFGVIELILLTIFLSLSGRKKDIKTWNDKVSL